MKVNVDEDPRGIARALESEPWIEEIAVRPRHLYLRVATEDLVSWLAERSGLDLGQRRGPDGDIAPIPLESAMSLTEFRSAAVRRSLHALPGGKEAVEGVTVVGKVDVRNGPLRMRCGGQVQAADMEEEVLALLRGSGCPGSQADAGCAASLAFLSTPRTKHVSVDDSWVKRAAGGLSDLRRIDVPGAEAAPEEQIRVLAFELNLLPRNLGLAREKQDPVYLARFQHAVARSLRSLPRAHPLNPVARQALDFSLSLLVPGWKPGSEPSPTGDAR